MPSTRGTVFGFLLAAPALFAQNPTPFSQNLTAPVVTHHRHHKSHKTAPLVLPPLSSGPLSQLPMDQIPASPAKVSYEGGLLSISAQNSNLGEILREVRQLTGASIEIPAGSGANERVVTHLGPGAPRDVLAGLLNGSSFNYVMMGSSTDPAAVASVILTAKPSASGAPTGETQTAANVYQNNPVVMQNNFPHPQPFSPAVIQPQPGGEPAADADDSKDEEENADDNTDEQGQPQAQPGQPAGNTLNPQDQQPSQDPNQPNAGPKTPEQILDMLRRPQQPGGAIITPPQPPQE